MAIKLENENNVFHLQTKSSSYIMAVKDGKHLGHVYWGKRIETPNVDSALIMRWCCFDPMENEQKTYSLDCVRQEYPTGCGGDYRIPALEVQFEDGSRVCPLYVKEYHVQSKKPALEGLPAVYIEDDSEAQTLVIVLEDALTGLEVELMYTVMEQMDVMTRSVRIVNKGNQSVCIQKVMSMSLDFEHRNFEMLQLPGAWGRERHIERTPLRSGLQSIESRRGASSHQMNPFLALLQPNTTEDYGEVYGMNFVYSGNFTAGAEVDQLGMTRVYMGINDYDFSWLLEPGESFQAPEVVMVYSDKGLGKMSRIYHKLYRTRLVRGKYRDAIRPVLANNWEATYFDFTEEKIVNLAKCASELGMELMVLDDGWFGKRNDDRSSLGDWYVNATKLPGGIPNLAKRVQEEGVQFGLWLEPEMVSPDSDLYRAHPDWCIHVANRTRLECRNQLTLDFSRKDVCDYIKETIDNILNDAPISYIKWDMNRHMSNQGSALLPPQRQQEMAHRYMLGLYDVLEFITSRHTDVLFESCSGGGGRFDAGMLYYMPQTWTSDDTDAVERLYIQYGTSLVYPISTMGAHVSAVPNHQSGRVTSLKMRGDVAMSGNFGYELDLNTFTEEEKEEVKQQIAEYKELRTFLMSADMYRLESPFEGNTTAWMFLSEDRSQLFAAYFRIQAKVNPGITRMKFTALEPDGIYEDCATGRQYRGDELMQIGIPVDFHGDYQSRTWHMKKL